MTATELYTLPDLIAWLETKDPQQSYNWEDCSGGCLLGQYVTERTGSYDGEKYCRASELGRRWGEPELGGHLAFRKPHTFGAALERARAAL